MKKMNRVIAVILVILVILASIAVISGLNGYDIKSPFYGPLTFGSAFAVPFVLYLWLILKDIEKKSSVITQFIFYLSGMAYVLVTLWIKLEHPWLVGRIWLGVILLTVISLILCLIMIGKYSKTRRKNYIQVCGFFLFTIVFTLAMMVIK